MEQRGIHKLGGEEKYLLKEFPDYFVPRDEEDALDVDFAALASGKPG
jgi:hypothetical protein